MDGNSSKTEGVGEKRRFFFRAKNALSPFCNVPAKIHGSRAPRVIPSAPRLHEPIDILDERDLEE